MQYFTGSKEHNIVIRRRALDRGLKLNEYGVFRDDTLVAGRTEEEVYRAVDLPWIPPELRENRGEIERAAEGRPARFARAQPTSAATCTCTRRRPTARRRSGK